MPMPLPWPPTLTHWLSCFDVITTCLPLVPALCAQIAPNLLSDVQTHLEVLSFTIGHTFVLCVCTLLSDVANVASQSRLCVIVL